jgi:hypothetical protein
MEVLCEIFDREDVGPNSALRIVTTKFIEFFQEGRGPGKRRGLLSQYLVNERDRDRPFAHSRGDTLHIPTAHVSRSKNTWQRCFEEVWPAAERPVRVDQIFRRQIGTGFDEAFVVERDAVVEPICIRVGSSHDEYVRNALVLGFACLIVPPRHSFQVVAALNINKLCMCEQRDVGCFFDPADQVFRHRVSQARAPDNEINALRALGEKYSGLSCGISTADHTYVFATA